MSFLIALASRFVHAMIRYLIFLSDKSRVASQRYLTSLASLASPAIGHVSIDSNTPLHVDTGRLKLAWQSHQPHSPFISHLHEQKRGYYAQSTATGSAINTPDRQGPLPPFKKATVEVEIEAFEERYAAAAARTVQDLIMLNFSAKVLQGNGPSTGPKTSSLHFGGSVRTVSVNWKPSRFTLIRGPHIDKIGMEQFEIRRFKRSVRGVTNDPSEVSWLIEHLQTVEFTGVQMKVHVTSVMDLDLSPSPSSKAVNPLSSSSLFSQHISAIPRKYLEPAQAMLAMEESKSNKEDEIKSSLSRLRGAFVDGLESRLNTLASSTWFRQWRLDSGLASSPSPPSASEEGGHIIEDQGRRKAAAMLVAIDQVLLSLPLEQMTETKASPESTAERIRFLTFVPGSSTIPASQWIHAVMKYGQYREKMRELLLAGHKKDLESLYSSYVVFSQALVASLIKQWSQSVIQSEKIRLGLPSQTQEEKAKQRGKGEAGSSNDARGEVRPRSRLFK